MRSYQGSTCILFARDFKEWLLYLTLAGDRLEKEKVVDAVMRGKGKTGT